MENSLSKESRVLVSERVAIPRPTIQGLFEAIRTAFSMDHGVSRLQYTKGEPLIVERIIPASSVPKDSSFVTPYQMVRQHAEIEILEPTETPIEAVCKAMDLLAEEGYSPTYLVTLQRREVRQWFQAGRIDLLLRLPFAEDGECPEGLLFVCGSQSGPLMGQIEYAVACRME